MSQSKTQIEKTAQRGGSIFSTLLGLARPLTKPAVKALASAGLSFGAEKALKKIFGNGYGKNETKLYKHVQAMTPEQKKAVENYLVDKGSQRRNQAIRWVSRNASFHLLSNFDKQDKTQLLAKFKKLCTWGSEPP